MPRMVLFFLCASVILAISPALSAERVTSRQDGTTAILENELVRVEFDLAAGIYRAIDKRDGSCGFRDGAIQVGDWSSTQDGAACRASQRSIGDSLGSGRALSIESVKPGRPTLQRSLLPECHRRGDADVAENQQGGMQDGCPRRSEAGASRGLTLVIEMIRCRT